MGMVNSFLDCASFVKNPKIC